MELHDSVMLITGASRGIGRETALAAAKKGARIAVNFESSEEDAREVVEQIQAMGTTAVLIQGDVSDIAQSQRMVKKVMEEFGQLDMLVNNAGIVSWKPLEEEKLSRLHRILDVNVKGMVNMTYAAIPYMKDQTQGGVIVNISSGAGKTAYPNLAVYSASKFAVQGFTQAVAQEQEQNNIRIYAVCPGTTATDMTGDAGMAPEKVAERIVATAEESMGLKPGEDTEIYS